jgi:hypothetical protein
MAPSNDKERAGGRPGGQPLLESEKAGLSANAERPVDPQAVRSHARGKRFVVALVGAWPLGVLSGLVAVVFGAGMPVALGCGLAVALGLNFLWVGVTFAIDDGDVEKRARGPVSDAHTGREGAGAKPRPKP